MKNWIFIFIMLFVSNYALGAEDRGSISLSTESVITNIVDTYSVETTPSICYENTMGIGMTTKIIVLFPGSQTILSMRQTRISHSNRIPLAMSTW